MRHPARPAAPSAAGALGAATVATAAVAAVLVAWAPWSAGTPGEGGRGREVPAQASGPPGAPGPLGTAPAGAAAPPAAVPPAGPGSGWIATLRTAMPYSATAGGVPTGTLPGTDPFGAPNVVAVIGRPGADGWSRVELPVRPDGSTAWLQTSATRLTWTSYRVAVSLEARTLTVFDGPATVLTTPVAVGAPSTPTPPGSTYLWELVRPDNARGAYGPFIFGLASFSNAIAVFNGGDAQIGIHGNDDPASIGRPVSHGCIRLDNAVITRLAGTLPLGTPVSVS